MRIAITEDDIAQGQPCSPFRCPVAKKIKLVTGLHSEVHSEEIAILSKYKGWISIQMPPEVKTFIDLYDTSTSRHLARPFSFELEIH